MCGKSIRCSKLKLWKAKAITNLSEQELRKLVWLHWVYIFWSRFFWVFFLSGGEAGGGSIKFKEWPRSRCKTHLQPSSVYLRKIKICLWYLLTHCYTFNPLLPFQNLNLLTYEEKSCSTMGSGMIRSTSKSGHTLLEVCSKNQWKPLFPQYNPRKSCYDNRVAGLSGHWRMDEQTGNEVADDSGHENHGSAGSAVSKLSKFSRDNDFKTKENKI